MLYHCPIGHETIKGLLNLPVIKTCPVENMESLVNRIYNNYTSVQSLP
jgi:hypothetical protein